MDSPAVKKERKPRKRAPRLSLGVIFDMDGVLVDSAEAHYEAWRRLGREIGAEFPRSVFVSTFGMHNRQIIPLWLGDSFPDEEGDRWSERKEAIYREVAAKTLKPLDGAVDLIQALAAGGFSLAVGSSGPKANVELVLDVLGVRDRFAALSTGDDVRHGKPNPEVFLKAAGKLCLPAPRCAVIEDAPQGVEAGLAAGSRVVAVATTRPAAELAGAHLVVESLRELSSERILRLFEGAAGGP
ncbi:MAG: HAD family phosphatase [Planctomycetes bacterium]|nr:HAD family phosphatase [Planctomycetota bacterium]